MVHHHGRRLLDWDERRVAHADGHLVAVRTRAGHTVNITADYAAADVVLANATTISGAQGRTAGRSRR